jgi:DNA-binding MarR family transcriptional regulator
MKDAPPVTLPDFDLDAFLPYRMTVAAERLSAGLARRYRAQFGISIPEWRVLVHLAHSGEVSVRDIERRVSMEKSKVSRAAARLEAEGYVAKDRHAGDRRLVRLSLTEKGRRLMADLLPLAIAYQQRLERLLAAHLADLEAALDLMTEEPE